MSTEVIGRVVETMPRLIIEGPSGGCTIGQLMVGAVLAFSPGRLSPHRPGSVTVMSSYDVTISHPHGFGHATCVDILPGTGCPSATVGDWVFADVDDNDDHAVLVAYLLSAVRREDWHAVSDAANDLRVLEASKR